MRRYELHRDTDASGVSGTGVVATGVQWPNGWCAMCWQTEVDSMGIYPSIENVVHIHGHQGQTRVVWLDPKRIDVSGFGEAAPEDVDSE